VTVPDIPIYHKAPALTYNAPPFMVFMFDGTDSYKTSAFVCPELFATVPPIIKLLFPFVILILPEPFNLKLIPIFESFHLYLLNLPLDNTSSLSVIQKDGIAGLL
jgi:hypothetical protein